MMLCGKLATVMVVCTFLVHSYFICVNSIVLGLYFGLQDDDSS